MREEVMGKHEKIQGVSVKEMSKWNLSLCMMITFLIKKFKNEENS